MALALPIGYLLFMLPVWDAAIDRFTVPLQVLSSDVSYQMLQLLQLNPYKESATFIYLNNFTLNVGAPCSGLKLILSVTAFTLFFMMIAKLKFWGNLVLACITIPFCVLMNGIRITMIGIVGNQWGSKAGSAFHDYSGYIIARFLGWKD
jgi:exosortase